ncbi:MAG TPA: hypothetical protein VMA36_16350 [Candidatus Limnocylindria bacterium]|jgi:hypothetical protein|nr:hypothetical protein [Candidatus Limnocylindria bacterium]
MLGLSTAAQAQSVPAATPTPPPKAKHERKLQQSAAFSHLPVLDVVPIFTQPAPFDTAAQTKGYDPVDVGGSVQIPLAPKLSYSFDRIVESIFNQASQRVLIDGVPTYPALSRDAILVNRLDYQLSPELTLEGGSSFRHREQAASGVSGAPFPATVSSSEAHYAYLSATYTTVPIHALGGSRFLFSIMGERQPVDHNVAVLSGGTVHYIDENPHQNAYYESTQQVGVIVPVDPRHGFTFSAREAWGAINFYENAPFPWRWSSSATLAITKKFNNFFSLTMRQQNAVYAIQGSPFPTPNALHSETIDVLGDFHFDLNALARRK